MSSRCIVYSMMLPCLGTFILQGLTFTAKFDERRQKFSQVTLTTPIVPRSVASIREWKAPFTRMPFDHSKGFLYGDYLYEKDRHSGSLIVGGNQGTRSPSRLRENLTATRYYYIRGHRTIHHSYFLGLPPSSCQSWSLVDTG